MFYKKRVLENSAKFTGKYLCQSLFFNKVAVWSLQLCWKKRLWYRCFCVNFAKFLRAHFLTENMKVVASVILLSWLWNHVQSQQQKNKVRFVGSLRDGVVWVSRWSRLFRLVCRWFTIFSVGCSWYRMVSGGLLF